LNVKLKELLFVQSLQTNSLCSAVTLVFDYLSFPYSSVFVSSASRNSSGKYANQVKFEDTVTG